MSPSFLTPCLLLLSLSLVLSCSPSLARPPLPLSFHDSASARPQPLANARLAAFTVARGEALLADLSGERLFFRRGCLIALFLELRGLGFMEAAGLPP